jgi:hypothetical protein
MNEKAFTDYVDVSYHENNMAQAELTDPNGRRKSVALNIVENPLKVSFFTFHFPRNLTKRWQWCSPFQRNSPEQTVKDARSFAESHGMAEHAALFGRAALVARDQDNFEKLPDLEEEERAALIYERDHKWHGSKMLWYSISLCAIGAATQGWDQTGSNGANLSFPEEFGLTGTGRDEWIVGLINAIIFLTAGLM